MALEPGDMALELGDGSGIRGRLYSLLLHIVISMFSRHFILLKPVSSKKNTTVLVMLSIVQL